MWGQLLYHPAGSKLPEKYHLWLEFADGSALTAMTQMWGAMELYEQGQEQERQYVKDMRPTPVEPEFTLAYFSALIDGLLAGEKRSAKALLTQEQLHPGPRQRHRAGHPLPGPPPSEAPARQPEPGPAPGSL